MLFRETIKSIYVVRSMRQVCLSIDVLILIDADVFFLGSLWQRCHSMVFVVVSISNVHFNL